MADEQLKEQYRIAMESKDGLTVKTTGCFIAALIVFCLSLFPLPTVFTSIVGLILCVAVYGICIHEINDGIISVFQKEPSNDALTAIALIVVFIQTFQLMFSTTKTPQYIVWVVFVSIGISMLMKLIYVCQIIANLRFISQNNTYVVQTADADLKKRFISRVCMVNPVIEFPNIVTQTYDSDPSEKNNKLFVPIVTGCAFLVSIIAFIFRGVDIGFLSFASLSAINACFTGEMAFVMPYIVAQHKLRKLGSILLGDASIENLKTIDTLVVSDTDLFPNDYAGIVNIRFFKKKYVSKSLEYAAVLLGEINSPIADSIFDMLDCEKESLPEIESLRNIQEHGLLGQLNGETVLLGNRNLLLSYDVAPLSQEQEATLLTMNRTVLYLAVENELAAILLVQYSANPDLKNAAEKAGDNFNIIVETRDCNINEYMVQKRYNLCNAKVIVPDTEEIKLLKKVRENINTTSSKPVMVTTKNAIGILSSVSFAKKLSKSLEASIFTRLFGVILGIVLTTVAILSVPMLVNSFWIFIFNLIWTFPIIYLSYN